MSQYSGASGTGQCDRPFQNSEGNFPPTQEDVDKLIAGCGLSKKYTFNSLRHTFARNALKKGIKLVKLAELMGLADVQQVMIYEDFVE